MIGRYDPLWNGTLRELTTVKHQIELNPRGIPVASAPYRDAHKSQQFVTYEVEEMLKERVTEQKQSEWALPVVMDPNTDVSLRFFMYFRKLISIMVRDTYELPRIDKCIDLLGDSQIFSTLDLNWGYWKIPIAEEYKDRTTFT